MSLSRRYRQGRLSPTAGEFIPKTDATFETAPGEILAEDISEDTSYDGREEGYFSGRRSGEYRIAVPQDEFEEISRELSVRDEGYDGSYISPLRDRVSFEDDLEDISGQLSIRDQGSDIIGNAPYSRRYGSPLDQGYGLTGRTDRLGGFTRSYRPPRLDLGY